MTRHANRLNVIFALYQSLLLNKDLRLTFVEYSKEKQNDDFSDKLIEDLIINKQTYIEEISKYLVNWHFERLSYVEQAILLEATSELKLGLNNKNVVIDEAITIAKEYCDDESYKFINGVLDNL